MSLLVILTSRTLCVCLAHMIPPTGFGAEHGSHEVYTEGLETGAWGKGC